jgi:octaprenyl-diphosphate synthase
VTLAQKLSPAVAAPALRDGTASIEPLLALTTEAMQAVNQRILDAAGSRVELIPAVAAHIHAAGGKRLRPMLTLAASRLCGYAGGAADVELAAAVEFIHTATLLHDDVVDESMTRRGLEAAHQIFGNKTAILVGDFLFARAFQMMVASGSMEALAVLSDASAIIAEGEVWQLQRSHDIALDEVGYREIVSAKTSALFAAACEVGAIISQRPDAAAALRAFGHRLGTAFQMMDDWLDYAADRTALGKEIGDDFREGKATLPVILAYRQADSAERAQWEAWFAEDAVRDEAALQQAIGCLKKAQVLEQCLVLATAEIEAAIAALATLKNIDDGAREALVSAARFCLVRGH